MLEMSKTAPSAQLQVLYVILSNFIQCSVQVMLLVCCQQMVVVQKILC